MSTVVYEGNSRQYQKERGLEKLICLKNLFKRKIFQQAVALVIRSMNVEIFHTRKRLILPLEMGTDTTL